MPREGCRAVRLTARERDGVLKAIERASTEASVRWRRILLFGSRTSLEKSGGDIDLLLEVIPDPCADLRHVKQRWRLALEDELGEQKFDLILDDGSSQDPFVDLARTQGVELWIND